MTLTICMKETWQWVNVINMTIGSNVLDQGRTWFLPIPGVSSTGHKETTWETACTIGSFFTSFGPLTERERERERERALNVLVEVTKVTINSSFHIWTLRNCLSDHSKAIASVWLSTIKKTCTCHPYVFAHLTALIWIRGQTPNHVRSAKTCFFIPDTPRHTHKGNRFLTYCTAEIVCVPCT